MAGHRRPAQGRFPGAGKRFFWMAEGTTNAIAISLNGEPHQLEREISVMQLVESLKVKLTRVAVELNREVVPKAKYADTIIRAGDVVEVINFVGGG